MQTSTVARRKSETWVLSLILLITPVITDNVIGLESFVKRSGDVSKVLQPLQISGKLAL